MRMAAYVRERPLIDDTEPAFAQGERIRRWATDRGYELVAVCTDTCQPGDPAPVTGLAALFAILDAGAVDGVVITSATTLGTDPVDVEIVRWEITRRSVPLMVVDDDLPASEDSAVTRRVLDRLVAHRRRLDHRERSI